MMHRKPSARSASLGVARTRLAVEEELGWLFREQVTEDFGIDAHLEVVDDEVVTGKLVALQIKSGLSFFQEQGPDGWWFRPTKDHLRYWTNHSLPVVLVMYNPETKQCHWQLIDGSTLIETSTGNSKVLVPERQILSKSARRQLHSIANSRSNTVSVEASPTSTGASPMRPVSWYGQRMPKKVRAAVVSSAYRAADQVGWDQLPNVERSRLYSAWVDDPSIGGIMAPYFSKQSIRIWLKDSLMKEYVRAKEGVGPYAQFVTIRYPTPDEIVSAACGNGWFVESGSMTIKPSHCFATDGIYRRHIFWGEAASFENLIVAALAVAEGELLRPIVVILHRKNHSMEQKLTLRKLADRAQVKLIFLTRVETKLLK
ncbi:DUF4365 domain-containing protein [Amycolatopsis umgeniensis]|uniref:DUF4365 domain-containing protein n=1 Tax=Amycolatopsis umgeniensis TaxID=336628 RepID=A0A841BG21_9PSEU|nr:DUF4365 domain-containing protein [Amycolatopsis umgeniensis]MBB5857643.1 hypothetical protein [Amycolatopsis umgeniensis]